jgi:hypothetical protein
MGRWGGAMWQARAERGGVSQPDRRATPGRWARVAWRGHAAWPVRTWEAGALMGGPRLHWRAVAVESIEKEIQIRLNSTFQIVSNFDRP